MKTHWLTTYTYTCSFCRCCRLYCWPLKVYAPLYLKGIITRWELGWRSGRLPLGARTEQKTWFYLKRPLVAGITLHFYVALNQRLETVNCWSVNLKTMWRTLVLHSVHEFILWVSGQNGQMCKNGPYDPYEDIFGFGPQFTKAYWRPCFRHQTHSVYLATIWSQNYLDL